MESSYICSNEENIRLEWDLPLLLFPPLLLENLLKGNLGYLWHRRGTTRLENEYQLYKSSSPPMGRDGGLHISEALHLQMDVQKSLHEHLEAPFQRLPHLYDAHMMEQCKGARFGELSPHVFAVAGATYWVILFVLMAGYLPFEETNLMALYKKIIKVDFTCPSWFSTSAKNLIKRILDPNPLTICTFPFCALTQAPCLQLVRINC
ncbi:uncharacterized protein LOC131249662 [Magnolia sinica]|uniref:uncharacterized protein LOC131249662 n=1 Tax=Magnolia sinica TaxID=86752 RepID=UPI002658D9AC|nr:uncharacterized protein LOC131249662 [Magnolia sinica]